MRTPKYLPRYLYHYTRFRGDSVGEVKDNLEQLFLENKIWFSCPLYFKDPFDCRNPIHLVGSHKDKVKYIEKLLKDHYGRSERRWRAKKMAKNTDFDDFEFTVLENLVRDISVLCLSTSYNNLLMFSHYADGHTGFCLQFDVRKDPRLSTAKMVSYGKSNRYPRLNRLTDSNSKLFKGVVLVKSRQWKYEQEYRVLIEEKAGLRQFESASLTGVILGCEIKSPNEKLISDFIEKRKDHVEKYSTSRNPHNFKLDFEPFEPEGL